MFRRKQLSDAKYVEQIRKRDRALRRMWWIWPLLLLAMGYCLVRLGDFVQSITADFPVEKQMMYIGLLLGVTFGFMFSMIAAQAGICIKQWIDARHGFRAERLMLKYHDELKNKETSNRSARHGATDSRADASASVP